MRYSGFVHSVLFFNRNSSVYSFLRYRQVILFIYLFIFMFILYVYTWSFGHYMFSSFFSVKYESINSFGAPSSYLSSLKHFCGFFNFSLETLLYDHINYGQCVYIFLNDTLNLSRYTLNYNGVAWFERCKMCSGQSSIPLVGNGDVFHEHPLGLGLSTIDRDSGFCGFSNFVNNFTVLQGCVAYSDYMTILGLYIKVGLFLENYVSMFGFFDRVCIDTYLWKTGHIFSVANLRSGLLDYIPNECYNKTYWSLFNMSLMNHYYNVVEIMKVSSNMNLDLYSAYYTQFVDSDHIMFQDNMIGSYKESAVSRGVFLKVACTNDLIKEILFDMFLASKSYWDVSSWELSGFDVKSLALSTYQGDQLLGGRQRSSSFFTTRYSDRSDEYDLYIRDYAEHRFRAYSLYSPFGIFIDHNIRYSGYSRYTYTDNMLCISDRWSRFVASECKRVAKLSSIEDSLFSGIHNWDFYRNISKNNWFFNISKVLNVGRVYTFHGYFGIYSNFVSRTTIDHCQDYSPWAGYWEGIDFLKQGLYRLVNYASSDNINNNVSSYEILNHDSVAFDNSAYRVNVINDICLSYYTNCYSNLDLYYRPSMSVHEKGVHRVFSSSAPSVNIFTNVSKLPSVFSFELDVVISTLFKEPLYIKLEGTNIKENVQTSLLSKHPLIVVKYGYGLHNLWPGSCTHGTCNDFCGKKLYFYPVEVLLYKGLCCIYPMFFIVISIIICVHVLYAYEFLLNDYIECVQFRLLICNLLLLCICTYVYIASFEIFLVDMFGVGEHVYRLPLQYLSTDLYGQFNQISILDEEFLKYMYGIFYMNNYISNSSELWVMLFDFIIYMNVVYLGLLWYLLYYILYSCKI